MCTPEVIERIDLTGRPVARMPSASRARPSVTTAATPRLLIMPQRWSPITQVPVKPSVAMTMTSPGLATSMAANTARLSAGPAWQVTAGPANAQAPSAGYSRALMR